jgi:hypothetical protein
VIFPLMAGWLYDRFNPGVPFWCGAVLVGATVFLGLDMENYVRADAAPILPPTETGAAPNEPVQEVVGQ